VRRYVTVCTSWQVEPEFFKFVVCNPCQFSPSLTILVPLWFIMISLVFFYLTKLLFSGYLQFKGNFVSGQNNWKYRDRAPVTSKNCKNFIMDNYVANLAYVCFVPAKGLIRDLSANSSNITFEVPLAAKWCWQSGRMSHKDSQLSNVPLTLASWQFHVFAWRFDWFTLDSFLWQSNVNLNVKGYFLNVFYVSWNCCSILFPSQGGLAYWTEGTRGS